ncbi:MAG: hypothetical protein WD773_12265 [Gemmatimonadales bacterium]
MDGAGPLVVPANGSAVIADLPTGSHGVALTDVAANCTPSAQNPSAANVTGGDTTAVALAIACVATGVRVTTATTGIDLDSDGYAVSVDGVLAAVVGANGSVEITRLAVGSHTVALIAVAANCPVAGGSDRPVNLVLGQIAAVTFDLTCAAVTGMIEVRAATSGLDLDPNGYTVQVDGGSSQPLSINGTVTFPGLAAGDHSVTFAGAAGNCTVGGANPRTVPVTTGGTTRDTARTTFDASCVAVTGIIETSAATSGIDLDTNGYTVQVDGGSPQPLAISGIVRFPGLAAGDHSVTLGGAAGNCTIGGENPRTVTVTAGGLTRDTARTTYQLSCVAVTGVIEVTTVTSGVNFDANGYQVSLDGGTPQAVGVNGVVQFSGVSAGDHLVSLGDAAPNCPVSGENPRTLSVAVGGITRDTARTTFAVACEPTTGTARIITSTTGVDLDPDGYWMGVDCYYDCYYYYHLEQMSPNDTVVVAGVPTGSHTFQIDQVAPNCTVSGPNPRTSHVTGGGTTDIVFTVGCAAFGSLQVTTSTTGVDFDASGYRITAPGLAASNLAVNETLTLSGLLAGSYTVSLSGVSLNCAVTTPNPVVVAVSSGGTATVSFAAACTAATQLAFAMSTGPSFEIHTIGSNGGGPAQLTNNTAYENAPDWSPDGSQIAFRSDRDGNPEIYVMQATGSGQTRLTNHTAGDYRPTWSPDGTRIAFVSDRDGNAEIYVMNANGTGLQRLTNHSATDDDPAWSRDGTKIAFTSNRAGDFAIYVMNSSDGSTVTQLTASASADSKLTWSPDGTKLAFSRVASCDVYGYSCERDLYVMNADGSGVTQLTSGGDDHADPAWSPDGQWIAFNAAPCSYYGCSEWAIRAVRSNGTDLREITGSLAFHPAWRP